MSRLIWLVLFLGWTFSGAEAFRTKNPTDHVEQGLRCRNIEQRICISAQLDVAKFNTQGINAVYDRMKVLLGEKQMSCKLTLNPDGSIFDLKILKSSGSKSIDNKALTIIWKAGPFYSSKSPVSLAYVIDFPYLHAGTML
jgi:TonB family protein